MPLIFTGCSVKTEAGTSFQALDSEGKTVPVKVSDEATQDFSLPDIEAMASEKSDRDEVEQEGSVAVMTSDFS